MGEGAPSGAEAGTGEGGGTGLTSNLCKHLFEDLQVRLGVKHGVEAEHRPRTLGSKQGFGGQEETMSTVPSLASTEMEAKGQRFCTLRWFPLSFSSSMV